MDAFVPEDIRALIARIEAKKGEKYRAEKLAKDAERARLEKIEALRQARKDDLRGACDRIDAWIGRFNQDAGPAVWQLLGEKSSLVIFVGKFSRGEPTPPGDAVCTAQLRIGGPEASVTDRLVYEELHKGQVTSKQPLLSADMLWQRVHPDFVAQCDAHLAGPEAWEHVRRRLRSMDGQLTSV